MSNNKINQEIMEKQRGHWSIHDIIDQLNELFYFERASAHILAGWCPKIPEMNVKISFGQHLYQDIDNANQLRNRINGLMRVQDKSLSIPKGWSTVMIKIDSSVNTAQIISGLYLIVKRHLLELYNYFISNTDLISDAPSVQLLKRMLPEKENQIKWAKKTIEHLNHIYNVNDSTYDIEKLWCYRNTNEKLNLNESIWEPLDRVPNAVRPHNMKRPEPGSLRIIPKDALRNPRDIGIFLHGFLNEEFATMELVCRNMYEHPDMPWEFQLDMARHASDESRHAMMLQKLAADYGVTYGDYPVYTYSYDGQYSFDPCEPNSKKELLWRMLIRQTLHEGLALDSLAFEIKKRDFIGQVELARIFNFLLADEVFHAHSGLKWTRYLCDDNIEKTIEEREIAHQYFVEILKRRRAKFVAYNIEKAIDEMDNLEEAKQSYHMPFHRTINIQARQKAGFTKDEIQQVINWDYVDP